MCESGNPIPAAGRLGAVAKTWILTGSLDNFRATARTRLPGDRRQGAPARDGGADRARATGSSSTSPACRRSAAIVGVTGEMYEDRDADLAGQAGQARPLPVALRDPSRRSCSTRTTSCRPWSWSASSSTRASGRREHWQLAFQGQLRTVSEADAELLERRIARAPARRRDRARPGHDPRAPLLRSRRRRPRSRGWPSCCERMRRARDRLTDAEARAALDEAAPTNGGGEPGRIGVRGLPRAPRHAAGGCSELEVVLRDLERGLVDFPSLPRRPRGLPLLGGGRG